MLQQIKKIIAPLLPKYGHYGQWGHGCRPHYSNTCPVPIDWMDQVFQDHDSRVASNRDLYNKLKEGNPNELYAIKNKKNIFSQIYAKAYRLGAIYIFGLMSKIYDYKRKKREVFNNE